MFTPYIPLIGCAEREPPKFNRQGWGLWITYHGQEPSLWLAEVLSDVPHAQTAEDYDRLLP